MVDAQSKTTVTHVAPAQKGSDMTGLVIHQCPKCELRFSFRTELEHHLNVDHPVPPPLERAVVKVDEAPATDVVLMTPRVVPNRHGDARWQRGAYGLVLAVAAMLLVAYAAVFVSMSSAVVIAVVLLLLVAMYVRRSRGWPRLPRR
jgi:hypothetical protein